MSDAPGPRIPLWSLVLLQAGVSGASLVVEIVAGRMIAPYVGMSLYTWTAVIAVVLAGFSAGHWWGGRIAGAGPARGLALTGWVLAGAALSTACAALVLRAVAGPVLTSVADPLAAITLVTALVFFLPSLFAGVPAPVFALAAMAGREAPERALGAMFAAGALGAIAGTLLAGFLFISWFGTVVTLAVVGGTYAAVAVVCFAFAGTRWMALAAVLPALAAGGWSLTLPAVCDHESQYYCIRTVDLAETPGDPVRLMVIDHLAHGISSGREPRLMLTVHTAMLDALPRMRMGARPFSAFFIGGGSYSVPRAWADRGIGPLTVAEIDPAVTRAAERDFWFASGSARVLHRDARVALAGSAESYDVIMGDAFTDITVPAHLVTQEFFRLVRDRLTPEGVFAMNLIDNPDRLRALGAVVATLRSVFPSVEVWTEARPPKPGERRVFVLLAGATDSPVSEIVARAPEETGFAALDKGFVDAIVARTGGLILTDDYVPVDRLVGLGRAMD